MENKNKDDFAFNVHSPQHNVIPVFTEAGTRQDWIPFGKDDAYPEFILDKRLNSSVNNAIITGKKDYIAGNGIEVEGASSKYLSFLDNELDEDTVYDILPMISEDLATYGGYGLLITWTRNKRSIAQITYLDFKTIRIANAEKEGVSEGFFTSPDFKNWRRKENTPVFIPPFSKDIKNRKPQELLYVKQHRTGTIHYPLPQYIAAMKWIILDEEIATFHLSTVQNQFAPSIMINMTNGIPSQEEQDELFRQFTNKYEGSANAGKVIITYNKDKDRIPVIEAFPLNDSDERFIMLQDQISQQILTGHRITNVQLFGIQTTSKLGGSKEEILESFELLTSTVIRAMQMIVENSMNKLLKAGGITDKFEIIPFKLFKEIEEQKRLEPASPKTEDKVAAITEEIKPEDNE